MIDIGRHDRFSRTDSGDQVPVKFRHEFQEPQDPTGFRSVADPAAEIWRRYNNTRSAEDSDELLSDHLARLCHDGNDGADNAGKLQFLVVTDCTVASIETECMLEALGHDVLAIAAYPEQALKAVARHRGRLNAAIVDAQLLGHPAHTVLKRLSSLGIPFILISERAENVSAVPHLGCVRVSKPVSPSDLEGAIRKLDPVRAHGLDHLTR